MISEFSKKEKRLIKAFLNAGKELNNTIIQALANDDKKKAVFYAQKVDAIIKDLKKTFKNRQKNNAVQKYIKAHKDILKKFGIKTKFPTNEEKILAGMHTLHTQAIKNLINAGNVAVETSLDGVQKQAEFTMALFVQNRIQNAIASLDIQGEGQSLEKEKIKKILDLKNIAVLKDRAGRKRNIQSYAEMLVRTENTRAYNTGTINTALEHGQKKFKIVEHDSCCPLCKQHDGEIIDYTKGVYHQVPPFHPNCRGYLEIILEEPKKQIQKPKKKNTVKENNKSIVGIFKTDVDKLAKKHGIEGRNTLEKMKKLNKVIKKGKGYQTKEDKEIYDLKEKIILHYAKMKNIVVEDNGKDTTIRIKEGKIMVNWHLSEKVKRKLKSKGLLRQ